MAAAHPNADMSAASRRSPRRLNDNRNEGTDQRNNGTENRNDGTDNRNNGTDNRNNGTDNRDTGTDNPNDGICSSQQLPWLRRPTPRCGRASFTHTRRSRLARRRSAPPTGSGCRRLPSSRQCIPMGPTFLRASRRSYRRSRQTPYFGWASTSRTPMKCVPLCAKRAGTRQPSRCLLKEGLTASIILRSFSSFLSGVPLSQCPCLRSMPVARSIGWLLRQAGDVATEHRIYLLRRRPIHLS